MNMKKILTFAAILLAANFAQAISFSWGIDGGYTYFGSGNKLGGITATLVYLGENETTYSILKNEVKNPIPLKSDTGAVTAASTVSTVPALKGKFTAATYDLPAGSQVGTSATDVLTAGSSTFGLYLTYTDGDNVTWYNVSSSSYTIPAGSSDITTGLSATFAFDWKQNDAGTKLTSGGGWTQVPEPSTAMLALAGLALLLKRRKA
jgi:hypothetical protein